MSTANLLHRLDDCLTDSLNALDYNRLGLGHSHSVKVAENKSDAEVWESQALNFGRCGVFFLIVCFCCCIVIVNRHHHHHHQCHRKLNDYQVSYCREQEDTKRSSTEMLSVAKPDGKTLGNSLKMNVQSLIAKLDPLSIDIICMT